MLRMTRERFAKGMTFEDYATFLGSPENLGREGFDMRRYSLVRPRVDWSGYFRERYARARLSEAQMATVRWIMTQAEAPANILVISEDWSSDCRRDVPYLARFAEAGGLALRIFVRDGDKMVLKGLPTEGENADLVEAYANEKNGQKWASVPVAVFFTKDFRELYRYVEYPAIYHKDRILGHFRAVRADETEEQARARNVKNILALLDAPIFETWASAGIDEILSALHERVALSTLS
jgi:thiol-disulfide isomerase/thioredoxin